MNFSLFAYIQQTLFSMNVKYNLCCSTLTGSMTEMVLNPWNCLSHVVECGPENHDQIGITVS